MSVTDIESSVKKEKAWKILSKRRRQMFIWEGLY